MSEDAKSRRDRLLTSLLAGDIAYDDERVRDMMAESEEFRGELEALRAVQARLEDEDAEREEILRSLEEEPPASLDPALERSFRKITAGPSGESRGANAKPSRGRGARMWVLLAAAAVLLAAVWIPWDEVANLIRPSSVQRIGDGVKIVGLSPEGRVTDYGTFRWEAPPDLEIDSYRLRILERKASGEEAEIFDSAKMRATEFTPTVDLPDSIVWRVLGLDRAGSIVAQGEAEAHR